MKPYYQEPNATVYQGHAIDILRELELESVDMVMSSPPYWGLRSYKTEPQVWDSKDGCRHEWGSEIIRRDRGMAVNSDVVGQPREMIGTVTQQGNFCLHCNAWRGELGLEPTIELYISHLIQIFNEVKRVLKKTGTCWVNIDDSYAGSGRGGNDYGGMGKLTSKDLPHTRDYSIPAKCLCLIPSRFALAMVDNGWILRNDVVWNKPNPMPESVKDRFTGSWEHLFFFVKNKRYFFEQQFEPMAYPDRIFNPDTSGHVTSQLRGEGNRTTGGLHDGRTQYGDPALGRNKRDVWEICTVPSPAHKEIRNFATFPEKLCETPILAGCPSMICKKCGKVREKVYENEKITRPRPNPLTQPTRDRSPSPNDFGGLVTEFKGYTDCGCNAGWTSGVVLDPFCGSGTTLAVAKKRGRKAIGIDISPDYCKLTVKRLQEIPLAMEFKY